MAPTNTNTAHTASTLSFKAWSTMRLPVERERTKYNRLCRRAEARRRYAPSPSTARVMQIANAASKRLIAREKKFLLKIVATQNGQYRRVLPEFDSTELSREPEFQQ
jgi:hypothetical protein